MATIRARDPHQTRDQTLAVKVPHRRQGLAWERLCPHILQLFLFQEFQEYHPRAPCVPHLYQLASWREKC